VSSHTSCLMFGIAQADEIDEEANAEAIAEAAALVSCLAMVSATEAVWRCSPCHSHTYAYSLYKYFIKRGMH